MGNLHKTTETKFKKKTLTTVPPIHVSFSTLTNLAKRFDMNLLIRVILYCRMEEAKFIDWTLNKLSIQFNQKLMQRSVNGL